MLSNIQLAKKFGRDKWDGPIVLYTRKELAKEIGVSERTLRRWEQKGLIKKPFNSLQGAGRGNHAVYKDPMEGVMEVLVKGDNVFIRYINGRIRWRKKRSVIVEAEILSDKEEKQKDELVQAEG